MCQQVSKREKGDKFVSSIMRLDRCCFLALLRVETELLLALWNDLRSTSVGFAIQEEKASCFRVTAS